MKQEDGAIKTRRVDSAIAYLRDFPNPTAHLRDFEATGIVERIDSLTAQLSELSTRLEQAVAREKKYKTALERWKCDLCNGMGIFPKEELCSMCRGTGQHHIVQEALKENK